jgi:starch-binding outer membrane protein, SusD/RagB family
MTAAQTHSASVAAGRCAADRIRHRCIRRGTASLATALIIGSVACSESNIPYYIEPIGVANTPGGIQNAVTGLFTSSRIDAGTYIGWMSGFARDEANIQAENPEAVVEETGLSPIPAGDFGIWDNEYRAADAALAVIAALPNVAPAYTSQQVAAITGIAQTLEALDFMAVAETRDTLGIPIHSISSTTSGPVYCAQDAWEQIVALLDTANDNLNTAGTIALPIKVPPGFASVGLTAGPSTSAGSFASFNRALAGKAYLELAYAKARNAAATHPTPSSPGLPDPAALGHADSAITASALYLVALAPPIPGPWTENAGGVYWDFSSTSGDLPNPINSNIALWRTLSYLTADVDTVHDLRFLGKFVPNSNPLLIPGDAFMSTNWLYGSYPTPSSPIPIIRNEGLVLDRAQVQLGLGNYAQAITLINQVHQQVGGFATPLSIAPTYTAVRDSLMKEERISTVFEASGDRTVSIRMYGLEAVADTTWSSVEAPKPPGGVDLHTTVVPIPSQEIEGRGGTYVVTCP